MEFHSVASIFPLMGDADLANLAADIRARGLLSPILRYERKILDGRNRYRACLSAKVKPVYEDYTGDDPISQVVSLNLHRRHLNESQLAYAASLTANMRLGDNQHRKQGGSADLPSDGDGDEKSGAGRSVSQEDAANTFGVSVASVKRAAIVQKQAVPEIIAAVERGELRVTSAKEISYAPPEEQRRIAALPVDRMVQAAKAMREERMESLPAQAKTKRPKAKKQKEKPAHKSVEKINTNLESIANFLMDVKQNRGFAYLINPSNEQEKTIRVLFLHALRRVQKHIQAIEAEFGESALEKEYGDQPTVIALRR